MQGLLKFCQTYDPVSEVTTEINTGVQHGKKEERHTSRNDDPFPCSLLFLESKRVRLCDVTYVDIGRALRGESLRGERSFDEDGVVEHSSRGVEGVNGFDVMDGGL